MNIFRSIPIFIVLIVFLFSIPTNASATLYTIPTSDRGNFQDDGTHYMWTTNYAAGNDMGNREFRSFYVFDMSSLIGQTITNATLSLYLPSNGYSSPDSSETYTLYDVLSTDISGLLGDSDTITDTNIFDDLGIGDSYGATEIFSSSAGSYVDIVLGSEALLDLNSAIGGNFAIGGAATSLNYNGLETQEVVFVNTQQISLDHTYLTIEATLIPEPSSILLLGFGLVGLVGMTKRKMKK